VCSPRQVHNDFLLRLFPHLEPDSRSMCFQCCHYPTFIPLPPPQSQFRFYFIRVLLFQSYTLLRFCSSVILTAHLLLFHGSHGVPLVFDGVPPSSSDTQLPVPHRSVLRPPLLILFLTRHLGTPSPPSPICSPGNHSSALALCSNSALHILPRPFTPRHAKVPYVPLVSRAPLFVLVLFPYSVYCLCCA